MYYKIIVRSEIEKLCEIKIGVGFLIDYRTLY